MRKMNKKMPPPVLANKFAETTATDRGGNKAEGKTMVKATGKASKKSPAKSSATPLTSTTTVAAATKTTRKGKITSKPKAPAHHESTLFNDHFTYVEKLMLARAAVQGTAGHNLNIGTPREAFIADFINQHVGAGIGIGTGEIIDAYSKPGAMRNQIDIVLHDERVPKLAMGGNISLFPIEAVKATIEVKSELNKQHLIDSLTAAENIGELQAEWITRGVQPRVPRRFLVAYASEASLEKVFDWMTGYYNEMAGRNGMSKKIRSPEGLGTDSIAMLPTMRSHTLDGIFVFGRGAILFPNFTLPLKQEPFIESRLRGSLKIQWQIYHGATGAAHLFFLALMEAILDSTLMSTYSNTLGFDSIDHKSMTITVKA